MAKSFVKTKNMLQFHLLSIGASRLDPKKWNYKDLKARFWRLYLHDKSGAAIIIGKQRIPLNPDQVYLIPPNVHFSAHTDKVLTQLNINFQIGSRLDADVTLDDMLGYVKVNGENWTIRSGGDETKTALLCR